MKIGCILVLYNPDITLLRKSVDSIYDQVDTIYLSDNSTQYTDLSFLKAYDKCYYSKMDGNIGIAAAQNHGLHYFIDNKYDFIIFMDQDSIPPVNLIGQLLEDLAYLQEEGISVGGIGPRPVNRQTQEDYKGVFKKGKPYTEHITEVISLISSATLIPVDNLKSIGLMEERLFIDAVDHEWCWRARYLKNMRFFISEKAKLSHQLGEGDHKVFGKNLAISTPFRSFYQYRNYFILIRRNYVPFYWKFINGIKYLIKYFYYPLFVSPRGKHFKQINRGIYQGILSKNK